MFVRCYKILFKLVLSDNIKSQFYFRNKDKLKKNLRLNGISWLLILKTKRFYSNENLLNIISDRFLHHSLVVFNVDKLVLYIKIHN